ncbi:MAG TPA: cyclic nucleotide-binding domain-containing protein [Burkholderiales bacterium]|nr:cyclic nucleotide-binding domain-containing protein [Burkholderiales bacterium]
MTKQIICRIGEIPADSIKECKTEGGMKLLVANSGKEYYAVQATCPHQDVPLCEGLFDGSVLTCHQHLWQWDIRSGAPLGLAEAPLEVYNVFVEGDAVYVDSQGALNVGELFAGIAESTLAALTAMARREEYAEKCLLYKPGDPAEDFFVLDSGRVEFQIGRDERTSPAGFMLKKGEVFGWAALLESQPYRIASARVLEKSVLLRINGKRTLKLLESDPASGYVVMRRLSALIARFLAAPGAK